MGKRVALLLYWHAVQSELPDSLIIVLVHLPDACEGLLYGVPRAAFMCVETGCMMLVGEMNDLEWDEFLNVVVNGEAARPAEEQRTLF